MPTNTKAIYTPVLSIGVITRVLRMTHNQFQMVFLLFAIEGNKHLKPKPYYCSEEEALYLLGSYRENVVKPF